MHGGKGRRWGSEPEAAEAAASALKQEPVPALTSLLLLRFGSPFPRQRCHFVSVVLRSGGYQPAQTSLGKSSSCSRHADCVLSA